MNRYMMLLFEHEDTYEKMSPEELQKEFELHSKWIEKLGDHFETGEPLEQAAKKVTSESGLVSDGPYIESKELISGFYIINANSMDEAAELAKGCPVLRLGGKVEVRPIMKM